jgi:hypothetical protein
MRGVEGGLKATLLDAPIRGGHLQAMAIAKSWEQGWGWALRAEAAMKPSARTALFAYGERNWIGWEAGAGARIEF